VTTAHFMEETGSRGRGRRAGEDQAAGVSVELARAVRLVGARLPAKANGYYKYTKGGCGAKEDGLDLV
jgi:hypothetical protein